MSEQYPDDPLANINLPLLSGGLALTAVSAPLGYVMGKISFDHLVLGDFLNPSDLEIGAASGAVSVIMARIALSGCRRIKQFIQNPEIEPDNP